MNRPLRFFVNLVALLVAASITTNGYLALRIINLKVGSTTTSEVLASLGKPEIDCPYEGDKREFLYLTYPPLNYFPLNIVWRVLMKNDLVVSRQLALEP